MSAWLLVAVILNPAGVPLTYIGGVYTDMDSCMAKREEAVNQFGRPIKNYQVICIETDRIEVI
jgi:hypothetical protein